MEEKSYKDVSELGLRDLTERHLDDAVSRLAQLARSDDARVALEATQLLIGLARPAAFGGVPGGFGGGFPGGWPGGGFPGGWPGGGNPGGWPGVGWPGGWPGGWGGPWGDGRWRTG
jgi:hypothetical protein